MFCPLVVLKLWLRSLHILKGGSSASLLIFMSSNNSQLCFQNLETLGFNIERLYMLEDKSLFSKIKSYIAFPNAQALFFLKRGSISLIHMLFFLYLHSVSLRG